MQTPPTVYVVDTDGISRNAVCRLARSMGLSAECYASGREFLEAFDPGRPGCLVTEVRIPDIGGLQIQRQLLRAGAPLPVVFLSSHATVNIVVRAMQAGAVHFLEKPPADQELFDVIQEALHIDQQRRKVIAERRQLDEKLANLTPEERELLGLLTQHNSTRTIAEDLGLSVRTIELRRSRIMKKLKMDTVAELLQFAIAASNGHDQEVFQVTEASLGNLALGM